MAFVSTKDLSVFINLLSLQAARYDGQVCELQKLGDKLSEEQIEDLCELQLSVHRYDHMLMVLREEYELALQDGSVLPSFAELTKRR